MAASIGGWWPDNGQRREYIIVETRDGDKGTRLAAVSIVGRIAYRERAASVCYKYFPFGKTARVDLVAEAFNLFNHTNVLQINSVFGSGIVAQASYLQPVIGAGPPSVSQQ